MSELNHSVVLYDLKVDQVLDIVKSLRAMGVTDKDFEFKYRPAQYLYNNDGVKQVNRSVEFTFRQPEYLTYISLKYSK